MYCTKKKHKLTEKIKKYHHYLIAIGYNFKFSIDFYNLYWNINGKMS